MIHTHEWAIIIIAMLASAAWAVICDVRARHVNQRDNINRLLESGVLK
jgi:hypothetical protein